MKTHIRFLLCDHNPVSFISISSSISNALDALYADKYLFDVETINSLEQISHPGQNQIVCLILHQKGRVTGDWIDCVLKLPRSMAVIYSDEAPSLLARYDNRCLLDQGVLAITRLTGAEYFKFDPNQKSFWTTFENIVPWLLKQNGNRKSE